MKHVPIPALRFSIALAIAGLLLVCCSGQDKSGSSAEEYFRGSYRLIDAGQAKDAIALLDLAVEKKPAFFEAYYNRGVLRYCLNEYDEAISDFTKTISLNPEYAPVYASRGAVYEKVGRTALAVADYIKAAKLGDAAAQNRLKSMGVAWQE